MNISAMFCVPPLSPRIAIETALGLSMPADKAKEIADDALLALETVGWSIVPAKQHRPGGSR